MPAPLRNIIAVKHSTGADPVEIHHGFAVTHAHPKHWHDEYLICAITGGGGYTAYRGSAHFTPPGSLFLLPPGEVHSNYATDHGCSYSNVYLTASQVTKAFARIQSRDIQPPAFVAEDPWLYNAFLAFCRNLEHADSLLQRDVSSLNFFQLLLHKVAGNHTPRVSQEPKAVSMARQFIDAHFDEDIALEHLAQVAGLSSYHLNRIFRERFGIPPHAYQIQLRIARAKVLLRSGLPISEVAHHTGFADQSHFTRLFKRMVGITPGRFVPDRKNVQYRAFAAD